VLFTSFHVRSYDYDRVEVEGYSCASGYSEGPEFHAG
jgi:hypothetical protein